MELIRTRSGIVAANPLVEVPASAGAVVAFSWAGTVEGASVCVPWNYPDFIGIDTGTEGDHTPVNWNDGIGLYTEVGVPSIAPSSYEMSAVISRLFTCDNIDFTLGTKEDIGHTGNFDGGDGDPVFQFGNGSDLASIGGAPYARFQIGEVTDPDHPNFGGCYAGVVIIGGQLVPLDYAQVGDIGYWAGISDPDFNTTTGLMNLLDGEEHEVSFTRSESSITGYIDGVAIGDDGLGIPVAPESGPVGSTHADWQEPVVIGRAYPNDQNPDPDQENGIHRVKSAVNQVFSGGGWTLVNGPEDALEFK